MNHQNGRRRQSVQAHIPVVGYRGGVLVATNRDNRGEETLASCGRAPYPPPRFALGVAEREGVAPSHRLLD